MLSNTNTVTTIKARLGYKTVGEGEDQYWLLGLRHRKQPAAKKNPRCKKKGRDVRDLKII